jgi:6-phosphogluconolactonase (cycloisomerase 2 family)
LKRNSCHCGVFTATLPLFLAITSFAQIAGLSPKRLVFSSQAVGTTSPTNKVILENTDSVNALTITSISASGNFTETSTCHGTLKPLLSCTISVRFAPTGSATLNGAVTIADTDPNSPHIVGLTGTGIGQVSPSPAALAFGTVAIGSNPTQTFKVTNNTMTTQTSLAFATSADYSVAPGSINGCGSSLAGKASCNESVTFAPTQTGALNGAVVITDTGSNSPQIVTLTGTGSGTNSAPITLSPGSLSFGKVLVGSSSAVQPVTVTNNGTRNLAITIAASGSYSEIPGGSTPCGAVLNAGSNCTVNVTFSPATTGNINGSISVSYTGTNSPQLATLTGTGIAQVTTSTSALSFVAQKAGTTSAARTVKLTNNTAQPVPISGIAGSGNYSVLSGAKSDCGSSLAAGKTCSMRVVFSPTHSGFLQGSITVTDGGNNSPQIISLSGIGIAPPKFAYANPSSGDLPYSVDPLTGSLTLIGSSDNQGARVIGLDPTARFLYGGDSSLNGLTAVSIDRTTGLLTPVPGSPFSAGGAPWSAAVDPSGRFVFVTNSGDGTVAAWTINLQTGAPTQIAGSPYTVDTAPFGLAADPSGRFLYVASQGGSSGNVAAFSINSSTAALTPLPGSPFSAGAEAIFVAVDPSGRFVYVSNFRDATVSAFAINSRTGALTAVKGSPYATGMAGPQVLVVDASGRFLYVDSVDANGVAGFNIDQTSGALTSMKDSPFPVAGQAIQTDPSGKFVYSCTGSGIVSDIDQSTGELAQTSEPGPNCGYGLALSGAVP